MEVHFKPTGWDIYCYNDGGSYADKSFIDAITVVRPHPIESDTCVFGFVKGTLDNAIITEIFRQCREQGFSVAVFSRPEGSNASRHAVHTHTSDGLDWYEVDLTMFN